MLVPLIVLLLFNCLPLTSQDFCSVVRQQFKDMHLGKADLVPYTVQEDYTGLCSSGGCCSSEMERAFRKRVRRDYTAISRTHFEHLYQSIKTRSEHFQMSVERYILHSTRLSLQTCSALQSALPLTTTTIKHKKESVVDLYSNLTNYFKQVHRTKDVSIKKLIKTFVRENTDIKKTKSMGCIKDISTKLEKALDTAWLVKESLKFVRSLFGSIRNMRISEECADALILMKFCSMCQPNGIFQIAEPCPKYCINVHKGCLAPILHLSPKITEWSRLVQIMLTDLRTDNSLFEAVSDLNLLVHSVLVNESDTDICAHKRHSFQDDAATALDFHLSDLAVELTLFEDVFDSLPHQLCDKIYVHPGSENHCWNGTAMSSYNCRISDNGFRSPNPTQVVMSDPMLEQQDARLKEILYWLYTHTAISPPPTPEITLDYEAMCWDPADNEHPQEEDRHTDNLSDKRNHHSTNTTTDVPHHIPNTNTSHGTTVLLSYIALYISLIWQIL